MTMLADKYEEINRYSELQYAVECAEARGEAKGEAKVVSIVRKKLEKGIAEKEIVEILDVEYAYVDFISTILKKYPQTTDIEIAKRLLKYDSL